jgi:hypothetical protein
VPGANVAAATPAASAGRKLLQSAPCFYSGPLGNIFISNFDVRARARAQQRRMRVADACARRWRHRSCALVRAPTDALAAMHLLFGDACWLREARCVLALTAAPPARRTRAAVTSGASSDSQCCAKGNKWHRLRRASFIFLREMSAIHGARRFVAPRTPGKQFYGKCIPKSLSCICGL